MTTKTIRRVLCLIIMLCVTINTGAVLKEKNLKSTLSVLRAELETSFNEQRQNMARYAVYNQQQHKQMISLMQRSDQIALMLYSQKQDFTFDMTYACHEATELYREFSKRRMPYDRIMKRMDAEIARYQYLMETLSNIPPSLKMQQDIKNGKAKAPKFVLDKNGKQRQLPFMLDEAGQADRKACLAYATALCRNLTNVRASVQKDNEHYQRISQRLKKVNDYAMQRYNEIQHNIFVNGDQNYLEIIASMPMSYHNAKADVSEKYNTEKVKTVNGTERQVYSQWRGPIVMGLCLFVLFYIIVAALLSNVLVRWLVPRRFRTENFMKKKVCLILFVAMFIFAVSVMVARSFMYHNFEAAHRVCLAAVCHLLLIACAPVGQSDQERISHLYARYAHVVHRHNVPYSVHSEQSCGAHLPPYTARVYTVAVERHNAPQRQHSAFRHILYVDIAAHDDILHRIGIVWLRAAVGAGADMVDVPAELHSDHHLRL